jgi:hypothetical protein
MIVYGDPETWGMKVDQFLDSRRLERESFADGTNPKIKMILDMLRRGMDVDTISTITGATVEEINNIAKTAKPISTEELSPEEPLSKNKTYSEIDILSNIDAKNPGGITGEDVVINPMPNPVPRMDEYMPEAEGIEDPRYRQLELADGGVVQREGFAEKGFVKLGRQPDPESMVGQIRTYLEKNYKKGDKVDVNQIVKLFNYDASRTNKTVRQLGLVPMNNEDKIAIKVQNFIDNYIKENNALPEQKIVKEGTKTDAQVIRRLLNKGRIQNIQLTRFEVNEQVAKYILNTEKPTVKGIKKILGTYEKDPSKVLTRIYVNSLNSLTNKLNKVDEGRSVFANFNVDEIEKLKYKVRQIPGFTSYYEREITDLIADAYKDQPEKKSKALKKVAKFKSFNNELKKIGVNLQLDHPLSYNFYKKAVTNVAPEELIRVKPIPERVNVFKRILDDKLVEIGQTLQKKPNNKEALSLYKNIQSIADEIGFDIGKISSSGQIISPQAAKIGDKSLLQDIQKAPSLQNRLRSFIQKVSDNPRMQSLNINLNEMLDLTKLPKINPAQYNKVIKNFVAKSGKLGIPLLVGYNLISPEEASAAETPDTISPEQGGLTKSEMGVAGAGLALGTKKGRELTGKALLKGLSGIGTPLGLVGLTAGLKEEDQSILDALKEEAQAPTRSLYPIFAKESVKLTRGATSGLEKLAGPTARRIAQQVLNLGLPFSAAAKIATKLTPFGYALGAYDVGKLVYDEVQQEKARISEMTPEERKQHELETENTMMMGEAMPENVEVTGEKNIPTTDDVINKYAYGGRVNFEKGGDPKDKPILPINPMIGGEDPRGSLQDPGRRDVLKGMGLLGAGVAAGKLGLLKLGKAIKKAPLTNIVKPMGKTMTQFPTWFPSLIKRFRKEGKQIPIYKEVEVTLTKPEYDKLSKEGVTVYDRHLGRTDWYKEKLIKEGVPRYYTDKKTDEIIGYKYEVKDLPGTIVKEMNGEEIRVYFPNAYGRNVEMTYKAPKVSVDMKGKKIKYDAEFEVNDAVPEMAGPEDVPDFFPGKVDNLDDVYGGASKIEQYATKAKQPRTTLGDEVVNRWDAGQPSMTVKELKETRKQRRRGQAEAKAVELGKPSAFNDTEFLKDFYELGDDFD